MSEWIGTAVIVAVLAAISVIAVIRYVRTLSGGCCGTGGDKPRRIEAVCGSYDIRCAVEVGGMSCEKCAVRIENGFNRQQGICAKADFRNGIVHIAAQEPIPELMIRKTIVDLGYTAGKILHE